MSQDPHSPQPVPIPESLRLQLVEFRRHLWRIKVLEAFIAGIIGLVFSFLLVYGLDRIWQTPGLVRLAILIGGTSLFAVFAPLWIHRWVWKHRRENQLATLIARRFPGLGDRLLGVIELQDQNEHAGSLSPRLRAAAMEAVAAEAAKRTLKEALPPGRHRKWAFVALLLAGGAAAVMTLTPRAGSNALKRWLMPLSDTPRYTFTVLDSAPGELAVPFGESFQITLKLSSETEQTPEIGTGRYGLQPPINTRRDQDRYTFEFPGQQDPGIVSFSIGDARHTMRVKPVQRPSAEAVVAHIVSPEYLQIPEKTLTLETGILNVVEGSKVDILLKTTRPLREANFGPTVPFKIPPPPAPDPSAKQLNDMTDKLLKEAKQFLADNPPPIQEKTQLILYGDQARTPAFQVGRLPFDLPFAWTDEFGIDGATGYKLRIDPLKDSPPVAYLQGVERQKAILPEETVDFDVLTEDDFGLKIAGIEWQGEFTRPTDEKPAMGGMKLSDGGPELRRFAGQAAFSPAALGIPPQKLTIRAYSEDYMPGRARVYSEPVTLYVLTRDEHAQMLKNQFDRAITELEDIARRERNELDENQRLEKLDGAELQKQENRDKLQNQKDAEAENTRRMEELAQKMEQLMKDAARNGEIDKDTLKKMAESMKDMKELSKQDMPKVDSKLGDASDEKNAPEQSKKDVEDAVKEQQKVVEKMQKAIDKANDANRRFEAGTFVNRLKKAASEEDGISKSMRSRAEEMFGLKTTDPEFDPADLRRLTDSARQQSDTASDVRWIQDDLSHYFTRTEKDTFKQILDEMRESKIDIKLEDIRRLLQENQPSTASDLAALWAARLTEWAKKLEGEMKKDQQGGSEGEGNGPNPEDEDFEFMLRVMKMIQKQQDIRSQTRALEQFLRSNQAPAKAP